MLDPESGDWTTLRVPYPLGFYHRGLDGRIDDPFQIRPDPLAR